MTDVPVDEMVDEVALFERLERLVDPDRVPGPTWRPTSAVNRHHKIGAR